MTSRQQIDDFLFEHRIAMVGVSRNPKHFSRLLFREFEKRLYEVIPVNPLVSLIDGRTCFPRVRDIVPPVTAALLMTPPSVTEQAVLDCAEAGVQKVWMYRGGGTGAVSKTAVEFCGQHGISVIAGECPFMFFPNSGFPHQLHGFIRRVMGSYPR
jgi:predicted CoA-binding protein